MSGVGGQSFSESPSHGEPARTDSQSVLSGDIEINNTDIPTNGIINNNNPEGMEIYIPKQKEIVIKRPVAGGKERPKHVQEPKQEVFVF